MDDVKSIEQAVRALTPTDLAEFRRWFADFDAAEWDAKIEYDATSGRLDHLAAEAMADYRVKPPREI